MNLTGQQRSQLRAFMDSKEFAVLEFFVRELQNEILGQSAIGLSEFDTLKLTFQKEFKIAGLDELMQKIESEASVTGGEDE